MNGRQGEADVVEFSDEKLASAFHRRRFLQTATAAAGGALLSDSVWAQGAQVRAGPPPAYNLRDDGGKNYITAVQDQDDPVPCNACTAFAVVAAVEGTHVKFHAQPGTPANPPTGPKLDAKELFLRNPIDPSQGGSGGCATHQWWPKNALARCTGPSGGLQGSPSAVQIKGFQNLLTQGNLQDTQNKMQCWIHSKGPVLAVMVQYEDFYTWGKTWSDTHPANTPNTNVYTPGAILDVCGTGGTNPRGKRPRIPIVGGHVVAIVGYNNPKKYWICKNSWGSDWNGDGFVFIEQGKVTGSGVSGCYIDLIDVWGVYLDDATCT
jgi:hypothetical protein